MSLFISVLLLQIIIIIMGILELHACTYRLRHSYVQFPSHITVKVTALHNVPKGALLMSRSTDTDQTNNSFF